MGYTFAKKRTTKDQLIKVLTITQDLKSNRFKKRNISVAKQHIEQIVVLPNEVFSFWKVVGNPTKKRGFVNSRSIVQGKTTESIGGGLCQLSGLLYLGSIHCGLEIIERHNHSVDIYTEETRYMPLGGDATVAFGYKDLKIKNNLKHPISFQITLEEDTVTIDVLHAMKLDIKKIDFKLHKENENRKEVKTFANEQLIETSIYKNLKY